MVTLFFFTGKVPEACDEAEEGGEVVQFGPPFPLLW